MWVTQRQDSSVSSRLTDQQTLLRILAALAACFSPVKTRRQLVFSLLPAFGHSVSGALFALRTRLIVFALTGYLNILSQCVWVSASNVAQRRIQHKCEALKLLKLHDVCSEMGKGSLRKFCFCFHYTWFNEHPAVCSTFIQAYVLNFTSSYFIVFFSRQCRHHEHTINVDHLHSQTVSFMSLLVEKFFVFWNKIKNHCTISYYISIRFLSTHMIVCVYIEPTSDCTHRFFSVSGESVQARCCSKANFIFWGQKRRKLVVWCQMPCTKPDADQD